MALASFIAAACGLVGASSLSLAAPWSLAPRECWEARAAHIRACVENTDKWMAPHMKGDKDLGKLTQDLGDPHKGYEAQVASWFSDSRESVRAFALGEAVRLTLAKKDMLVSDKDLTSAIPAFPPFKSQAARELASQGLSPVFAFSPSLGDRLVQAIWQGDSKGEARWKSIGKMIYARAADTEDKLAPAQGRDWISQSTRLAAAGQKPTAVGAKPLDAEMVTWDGNSMKLSDFKGRPILLLSTAWWCGACRLELPELAKVISEGQKEVGLVAILLSGDFDVARTLSWMKTADAEMPVVWSGGAVGLYAGALDLQGWPDMLLIGKDFKVGPKLAHPNRVTGLKAWLDSFPSVR